MLYLLGVFNYIVIVLVAIPYLLCASTVKDIISDYRQKVPTDTCRECAGRGQVPNHHLQVFEACSACVPAAEPVQGPRPGSRSRTSGLAERTSY